MKTLLPTNNCIHNLILLSLLADSNPLCRGLWPLEKWAQVPCFTVPHL
jgi:hypothetical protein